MLSTFIPNTLWNTLWIQLETPPASLRLQPTARRLRFRAWAALSPRSRAFERGFAWGRGFSGPMGSSRASSDFICFGTPRTHGHGHGPLGTKEPGRGKHHVCALIQAKSRSWPDVLGGEHERNISGPETLGVFSGVQKNKVDVQMERKDMNRLV